MKNINFSDEELFSSFYDLSPVCIWIKDVNNTLVRLNKTAAALEQKPVEELEGKSCFDIYPEETAQAFWKDDLEVITSGNPKLSFYEFHTIPGTDIQKWMQVNKMPIKDKEGNVKGVMVYAIDVDEVKRSEENARQKEEMTQKLMDIAPFPIVISSLKENKFLYVNHMATAVFDTTAEEAMKVSPKKFYTDINQRSKLLNQIEETGWLKSTEVTFKKSDGQLMYGLMSGIKIDYKGEPCSYVIYNDITGLKENEQKLIQKAEEFRIVFENSTDAILWADTATGTSINCNRSAEAMLKLPRNQIIGRQHWEIHPVHEKEKYQKLFTAVDKTNAEGMDIEVVNSLGEVIPVRIAISTVKIEDKGITQAIINDISERILFSKALIESEQRYRAVVNNAPVIFFEVGRDGIVRLVEGKGLASVHLKKDELLGKSVYDLLAGKPEYLNEIEKLFRGESLNLLFELGKNTYNTFFSPINDSGEIESIIGIAVDISEKAKTEKILLHERNIFKTIIDIIPDQIYVKDEKSRFLAGNKLVADRLNAANPGDILGKTDFDFFPEEEARVFFNEEQELMRTGIPFINNERKSIINGVEFYHEITKIPFYDAENKVIGLVGASRDITGRKKAEAAIRASEAKFRIMAENMKDVVWQLSPDMVFTYLSPSFYQLSGFQPSEFVGKPLWELITKESGKHLLNFIQKRKNAPPEERKNSMTFEAAQYHANKSLVWTEIVSNPVFGENGELLFFQGMTRDITPRKLAELALKESQEKLGIVVANAPIVLYQIDNEGIFRVSDGKGLEKLGLKPGEVVGHSAFDIYRDYPDVCRCIREALSGKAVMDIVNIGNLHYEAIFNPVFNSIGEVTSIIGIALDFTERKLVQDALYESELRFKTLFHEMAEGVALHELVTDDKGVPYDYKIVEVNPAYSLQTGYEGLIPKDIPATLYYHSNPPPYLLEFSAVALTGNKYKFETFFEPADKFLKISAVSLGNSRFATVLEDVTSQKKHEKELRDKNDELERFTYTVSHDLKSPLVTIKGFIGMLEQDLINQNQDNIKDDMQRIKSATDKMTDLLNDLLELSRIGRHVNPPVKVSMLNIVEEAVELSSGILSERNVELQIPEKMPEVYVDKQRILEVWLNLIENAVKFTEKMQKPKIIIGFHQEDAKFIFSIQDNGIGIDKKYHHIIFGLFNKLDNKSQGTGIGLALVKRIAEVHGGEVWVDSEGVGKGAKFSFSVPVKVLKKN
jgi:PAS domain S-box-containing protein